MATKLHSAVSSGSRHPIHQLEYPDAANRIAGIGEITGATPKDYDVAKQNDDDSLWFLKDAGTLDWDQIMTGGVSITFEDDKDLFFGNSSDAAIQYDTTQTPDSWLFGVPATSNALIVCLKANMGGDYAHGLQTNPTLFIHSAIAAGGATNQWISITHDQTDGVISVGTGIIKLNDDVNCTGYLIGGSVTLSNSLIYASASTLGAIKMNNTAQTNASVTIHTGSVANSIIICEHADGTYNFQYPQQVNPTLCIRSANQSTTEYIAVTHDQTNGLITCGAGGLTVAADWIRTSSAVWYNYRQIDAFEAAPGASGATFVPPSANTLGGYQLNAATEFLYFASDVHADWDAASDIKVTIHWEINAAGVAGADSVDLQLLVYLKGTGDTACKTQTLEVPVTVGTAAQYTAFVTNFAIDYDDGGNPVDVGDVISMRLNLETDTSEVTDITVNHIEIYYATKQVGIEI